MKKYLKETITLLIQLTIFYICPLFAKTQDMIGLISLIITITFILSIVVGIISKQKTKYLYPIIISILFIPTVFIYYNESALIHALWYLIISYIGIILGSIISKLTKLK